MSIAIPDALSIDAEIKRTRARLQALLHLRKAAEREERGRIAAEQVEQRRGGDGNGEGADR